MAEEAYCPAVQSAQSVLATTLLNLPTGQSEQETEPLAAENTYFPGTQLVQAVAPVVLVPVAPAGQASQELSAHGNSSKGVLAGHTVDAVVRRLGSLVFILAGHAVDAVVRPLGRLVLAGNAIFAGRAVRHIIVLAGLALIT